MNRALLVVALFLLAVAGCADSGGNSADSGGSSCDGDVPNVSGAWQGNVYDSYYGTGTVVMTVQQNGKCLEGGFTANFGWASSSHAWSGNIDQNGAINGEIIPNYSTDCPAHLTAQLSGSSISGSYLTYNCAGAQIGNFNLSR